MVNLILMNAQIFKNCLTAILKVTVSKLSTKLNLINVPTVQIKYIFLFLNFKIT